MNESIPRPWTTQATPVISVRRRESRKLSGTTGGRGCGLSGDGGGASPKRAAGRKILWVAGSRAIVRALFWVCTVATTRNCSGVSSSITVSVPSIPFELNTKPRSRSKAAASGPAPMRTRATCLPVVESVTAITWFAHTENRR